MAKALTKRNITCWVITEGIAGTENQCLGVCDALEIEPVVKRVALREPWRSLSPGFRLFPACALSRKSDRLEAPYPDLILAAGRKSVVPALALKQKLGENVFLVMLQNPGISAHYFDLVSVPYHDQALRGSNVIVTQGAPNRISAGRLNAQSHIMQNEIKKLNGHKIAILIGGESKRHTLSSDRANSLCSALLSMQKNYHAALMITMSRRTSPRAAEILRKRLSGKNIIFWNGEGENPYGSFLHHADTIMVTEDSVSMISDAATTGKPVYRLAMDGKDGKFRSFYDLMEEIDAARPFQGVLDQWHYTPLQDAHTVAKAIEKALDQRR